MQIQFISKQGQDTLLERIQAGKKAADLQSQNTCLSTGQAILIHTLPYTLQIYLYNLYNTEILIVIIQKQKKHLKYHYYIIHALHSLKVKKYEQDLGSHGNEYAFPKEICSMSKSLHYAKHFLKINHWIHPISLQTTCNKLHYMQQAEENTTVNSMNHFFNILHIPQNPTLFFTYEATRTIVPD